MTHEQRVPAPAEPLADRHDRGSQPDHADRPREDVLAERARHAARHRLPGGARQGRRGAPDHRQPARPPHLDDRQSALHVGVPQGRRRDEPAPDRRGARARRRDLRAAQPLRRQRHLRFRRRHPRPVGPVERQEPGLRRDAEGDGARGHSGADRLVGTLRRVVPRGRLRRHRGAHRALVPAPPVPQPALQQAHRRVRRLAGEPPAPDRRGD